ncbi:hypothetical protein HG533_12020, partial [Moraxella osloensis]
MATVEVEAAQTTSQETEVREVIKVEAPKEEPETAVTPAAKPAPEESKETTPADETEDPEPVAPVETETKIGFEEVKTEEVVEA